MQHENVRVRDETRAYRVFLDGGCDRGFFFTGHEKATKVLNGFFHLSPPQSLSACARSVAWRGYGEMCLRLGVQVLQGAQNFTLAIIDK